MIIIVTPDSDQGGYVAQSEDPALASQGDTRSVALRAYAEALELLEDDD